MTTARTGEPDIDAKITEWLSWDKNKETLREIADLVEKKNVEDLRHRLLQRMEFGTAGLRAKMGAGYSMMNDLTIIQATQGLVKYLVSSCPSVKEKGVVIGYDGRHNSSRWSKLASTVIINEGVPVYNFSTMVPTPYVPYSVLHLGAQCGIMITASHNPKEDNGYKVYWTNGAQIISPIDQGISSSISANLEPLPGSWNTSILSSSPLYKDPLQDIVKSYNLDVLSLSHSKDTNASSPVKFTYTAMHGVGYKYVLEAFKAFNFKPPIPVKQQVDPDPEFPTVKYPNPEEGKGALLLSMETADKNGSPVIIANDPDADRLAVAEKSSSGEWKIFSGNETGALLGWWLWKSFRQQNPNATASDVYMISSTVSSKILNTMAEKEGFSFEETLTGFKWMANKADELMKKGKTVLLAFEEAIGFMCGCKVLDKDGISGSVVCAELATHLYRKGLTLQKQLDNIYTEYGYHLSSNSYFICHDTAVINQMFHCLRNMDGTGKYPTTCGPYKIKYIRDLTTGYDNSRPDGVPLLPVSKSSHMITFTFENGCIATLRTSGTEPKIKYYTEHKPKPETGLDKAGAQKELDVIVECIKKYFFQPDKFDLIPRPVEL
ncbi:phosphoglucomutase-2-like [Gigantopelta aegis]|uniref:phosphoglucomutase-2-like n=1 Tax=Gigantopelta aegis TaxID=1735272 RepID=UPI001B88DF21|nr:phosphoglucomutase-2-like [Gigantopelta aegis]